MVALGVNIAVIQNGRVLLALREDFAVWCLPGGHVDEGETIEAAALREAREETGLEIEIKHLVGVYSTPELLIGARHNVLVVATLRDNIPQPLDRETLAIRWCDPNAPPNPLMWWHNQRIKDAVHGASGIICSQPVSWPFRTSLTRQELYQLRDESKLSRADFFLQHFGSSESEPNNTFRPKPT